MLDSVVNHALYKQDMAFLVQRQLEDISRPRQRHKVPRTPVIAFVGVGLGTT